MGQATYDDVNLILRLYEIRREEKLRTARAWFVANFKFKTLEDYKKACPPGSQMDASARMVISYWEMVASFATSGVLNQELFFQSTREMLVCWLRVKPILEELRATNKDPNAWKNLETLATAHIRFLGSETSEAFAARMG